MVVAGDHDDIQAVRADCYDVANASQSSAYIQRNSTLEWNCLVQQGGMTAPR